MLLDVKQNFLVYCVCRGIAFSCGSHLSCPGVATARRLQLENLVFYANFWWQFHYLQTSNIRRTIVGNKTVDHSDVVGASPVGAAPTTSSFST